MYDYVYALESVAERLSAQSDRAPVHISGPISRDSELS